MAGSRTVRHQKHNVLKGRGLGSGPVNTGHWTPRTNRRHLGQINDEIADLSPEYVGREITETQSTTCLILLKVSHPESHHNDLTI